jgi:hypothetical protein
MNAYEVIFIANEWPALHKTNLARHQIFDVHKIVKRKKKKEKKRK